MQPDDEKTKAKPKTFSRLAASVGKLFKKTILRRKTEEEAK